MKLYLLDVFGRFGPSALGPFDSEADRDEEARQAALRQADGDIPLWADVDDAGNLTIGSYAGAFPNEEAEAGESVSSESEADDALPPDEDEEESEIETATTES